MNISASMSLREVPRAIKSCNTGSWWFAVLPLGGFMAMDDAGYVRSVGFSPSTTAPFHSVRRLGLVVVAGAAAVTVLRAIELVLNWVLIGVLHDVPWALSYESTWFTALETSASAGKVVAWTALGLQVLTGVVFIAWIHRARRNAEALCTARHRCARVWIIAGFLPVVNSVIPPLLVDDIQRASDPATPRNAVRLPPNTTTGYVVAWWLCFALGTIAIFVASLLSLGIRYRLSFSAGPARAGLVVQFAGIILFVVAVVVLAVLLARVVRWQDTRAQLIDAPPTVAGDHFAARDVPGQGLGILTAVLSCAVAVGPALIALASPRNPLVRHISGPFGGYPWPDDPAVDTWIPLTLLGVAIWVVTLISAGVLFVCWLWRVRVHSGRMSRAGTHMLEQGWVIAAWFVPVANLVLPALVVGDVYGASRQYVHAAATGANVSPLVVCWWLSWLATWTGTCLTLLIRQPLMWWGTSALFALTASLLAVIIRRVDYGQQTA
ncbi:DUF4328 domain-containing protein [Nocardia sp. NPDC006044]|uniref:DUF4328 domain-containing protein n=1 Tax=Nocardia sp. NPDC006044 TaxID=3364306 RepID=UPI003679C2CC